MKVSVIIVNYNVKHFLEQCLCSVRKACAGMEAEVLVVDNNSTDGSREYLEPRFPNVQFTWNSVNLGFAKANNQALETAKGEYILFLNPDTLLPEDCISQCLQFFSEHPEAGALGVRMVDGTGKFLKESKRAFPSPVTSFNRLSGLSRLFPKSKFFNRYYLGYLPEKENHEVDVLAGAFMMLPKKVLGDIGSFDETFFMYGEDVDLSYRVQQAGYKNYYFAGCSIIHFKGESTKKGSLNYIRLFYNAMSLFVKKHYSGSRAGLFNFFVQSAIWGRAAFSAFGKFVRSIGLPLIDAAIILGSFWITKFWWSTYVMKEANYSPNILVIAFPVYTAIFLTAAFFSGLYDKGYRQMQLNKSTFFASLVLFSSFLLLPPDFRFSRGILFFGIITAFIAISIVRWFFVKTNIIAKKAEDDEQRQTLVVSGVADFKQVTALMQQANMHERVLGRVSDLDQEKDNLGSLEQLPQMVRTYGIKEVIFCEDGLSYKEIIGLVKQLPSNIRYKFHSSGSSSIVGSDDKDQGGETISVDKRYSISLPVNRRNKRLADVLIALLLLISFPVHLFTQKKPGKFFSNIFKVLIGKRGFIGYATGGINLPIIKKGILTSTSLPAAMNKLPADSLLASDEWYASAYTVYTDLQKIKKGYRYLSE